MQEKLFFKERKALLKPVIQQGCRLLEEEDVALFLFDEAHQELELVINWAPHAAQFLGMRLKLGEGLVGQVAQAKEPMIVNDYGNWEGRLSVFEDRFWENIMAAPLIHDEKLYGVLAISDATNSRPFTEDDLRLLSVFSHMVALTLANVELHEQTQVSEQRYRALVEHALVGVYVLQDEKIVYANPQLAEIFGYALDEIIGMSAKATIAPEDYEFVRKKSQERLSGKVKADCYTYKALRKDGTVFPVEIFASLVQYNNAPASQGMIVDISDRQENRLLLDRLLAIGSRILSESDINTILQHVCDVIVEHSPFQAAAMSVFGKPVTVDQEDVQFKDLYIAGLTEEEESELMRVSQEQGFISNRTIVEHGQSIGKCFYVTPDRYSELEKRGIPLSPDASDQAQWGPLDNLYIMLQQGDLLLGRISLARPKYAQMPSADTLETLEVLANLAALAVNNAQQTRMLNQQQDRLHGFYQLGEKLAQLTTQEALLAYVIKHLRSEFSHDYSTILLVEGDELVLVAKDSPNATFDDGVNDQLGGRAPMSSGVIGWVASNGEPLLLNDARSDPRYVKAKEPTQSELCAPILFEKELLGVINIESARLNAFERGDLLLLASVAAQLALALTNLKRYEALKDQAIRDGLTGLYNRRYFNESLQQELHRANRYQHPIAILFVDVDHMHQINNTFGHLQGDFLLKEVANLLQSTIRSSDLIFRFGGDEFVALLPETNGEVGIVVDRVKEVEQQWNEKHRGNGLLMSLSLGISSWEPGSDQTLEDIIQQADLQMFKQKRSR